MSSSRFHATDFLRLLVVDRPFGELANSAALFAFTARRGEEYVAGMVASTYIFCSPRRSASSSLNSSITSPSSSPPLLNPQAELNLLFFSVVFIAFNYCPLQQPSRTCAPTQRFPGTGVLNFEFQFTRLLVKCVLLLSDRCHKPGNFSACAGWCAALRRPRAEQRIQASTSPSSIMSDIDDDIEELLTDKEILEKYTSAAGVVNDIFL